MKSSARSDRTTPTPARMEHRCVSPSSRSAPTQRSKAATSNTYWVCMNCAPAAIFFAARAARNSSGGANGFSTAPRNSPDGGGFSSLPLQ